jgi:hypothetical protein
MSQSSVPPSSRSLASCSSLAALKTRFLFLALTAFGFSCSVIIIIRSSSFISPSGPQKAVDSYIPLTNAVLEVIHQLGEFLGFLLTLDPYQTDFLQDIQTCGNRHWSNDGILVHLIELENKHQHKSGCGFELG